MVTSWLPGVSGYLAGLICPGVAAKWFHPLNGKFDAEPVTGAISSRMDGNFKAGQIDAASGLPITPNNHRILVDGHSLSDILAIGWSTGSELGVPYIHRLSAARKAFLQDFCSPAGMPIGRIAKHGYRFVRKLGLKDTTARRITTVNAERALGALLTGVGDSSALLSAWRTQDARIFCYTLGASSLSTVQYKSPFSGIAVLTGLAASMRSGQFHAYAFQKGVAISCVGRIVTLMAAPLGPLALLPAVAVCRYLDQRISDDRPLMAQLRKLPRQAWGDMQNGAAHARRVVGRLGWRERQVDGEPSDTLDAARKVSA